MFHRSVKIWIGLLLCVALVGCNNPNTPENVALRFIDASNHGDQAKILSLVTEKAAENMRGSTQYTFNHTQNPEEKITVSSSKIQGERAEIGIHSEKQKDPADLAVLLRQVSGQWRVYGIRVYTYGSIGLTIDFENPASMLGDIFQGVEKNIEKSLQDSSKAISEGLKSAGKVLQKSLETDKDKQGKPSEQ